MKEGETLIMLGFRRIAPVGDAAAPEEDTDDGDEAWPRG